MSFISAFDRASDRARDRRRRFRRSRMGRFLSRVAADARIAWRWPLVPAVTLWVASWVLLIPAHYPWVTDQNQSYPVQRASVATVGILVTIVGVIVLVVVSMRRAAAIQRWGHQNAPQGWRRRVLAGMFVGWSFAVGMMMYIIAWPFAWAAALASVDVTRILVWRRFVRTRLVDQVGSRIKATLVEWVGVAPGLDGVRWMPGTASVDWVTMALPHNLPVSKDSVRDGIEEAIRFTLDGPEDNDPETAASKPEREFKWDHVNIRVTARRVPALPTGKHPVYATPALIASSKGVVIGQCTPADATDVLDGIPVYTWLPTRHAIITGATGAGKSNVKAAIVASALAGGHFPGGFFDVDGKESGSVAPFVGREGLIDFANRRDDWDRIIRRIEDLVDERYAQMSAWRFGETDGPEPHFPRVLAVFDEIQEVMTRENEARLVSLAKRSREAGLFILAITQRASHDAVSKSFIAQMDTTISLGRLDGVTARMAHVSEADQQAAQSTLPTPGRMVAVAGGRPGVRVQALRMPDVKRARTDTSGLFPPLLDETPAPVLTVVPDVQDDDSSAGSAAVDELDEGADELERGDELDEDQDEDTAAGDAGAKAPTAGVVAEVAPDADQNEGNTLREDDEPPERTLIL